MKTIGIVGSGAIGKVVAYLSTEAGYDVIMSNSRGPQSLQTTIKQFGPQARAGTVAESVKNADLVVLATPLGVFTMLPKEPFAGKVIIDTMNYYPVREGLIFELEENQTTSSELVQNHFSESKLVKTMHNQTAPHLYLNARRSDPSSRTCLPLCGNDAGAKALVAKYLDSIGYKSVDCGPLKEGWKMEPGTPIYGKLYCPVIPSTITDMEERKAFFMRTAAPPVSEEQCLAIVQNTSQRSVHKGTFPADLSEVWRALINDPRFGRMML